MDEKTWKGIEEAWENVPRRQLIDMVVEVLLREDELVATQNELLAVLKTILNVWDASEDMEREINEARELIARMEAE